MQKSKLTLRALTEGAVFVALAQILSYLKLFELPQGGSITVAMLPIFIYCARWGFGPGMLASFVYSLLQLFLDGAYAWGWQSMLGDYIVAFTALGVAGLFHRMKGGFFIGAVPGALCCWRYGLGGIHAGFFLWHDNAQSLVLFLPLQWQLYVH